MVEIVFDEEGRLVRPKGVRLLIPEEYVVDDKKTPETDEERAARVKAFFTETRELLQNEPRNDLPEDDPLIIKYRRMGLLD